MEGEWGGGMCRAHHSPEENRRNDSKERERESRGFRTHMYAVRCAFDMNAPCKSRKPSLSLVIAAPARLQFVYMFI